MQPWDKPQFGGEWRLGLLLKSQRGDELIRNRCVGWTHKPEIPRHLLHTPDRKRKSEKERDIGLLSSNNFL